MAVLMTGAGGVVYLTNLPTVLLLLLLVYYTLKHDNNSCTDHLAYDNAKEK